MSVTPMHRVQASVAIARAMANGFNCASYGPGLDNPLNDRARYPQILMWLDGDGMSDRGHWGHAYVVEVFEGNVVDKTTFENAIQTLRKARQARAQKAVSRQYEDEVVSSGV